MTAITVDALPAVATRPARPPLGRLTLVELRKMTNTRSGRWLLAVVGLAAVGMMLVVLFAARSDDRSAAAMFVASQVGVVLLLPVLGILSVTSEWSQRTALTTFALVPKRERVAVAKLLAASLLATTAVLTNLLGAWACRAVGGWFGRTDAGMTIPASLVATCVVYAVIMVLTGVAFGMLLLNAPLAIVVFFVAPTLLATLGGTISALNDIAPWVNTFIALEPLHDVGVTAREWAKIGTSASVWLVAPLVAGLARLRHSELK